MSYVLLKKDRLRRRVGLVVLLSDPWYNGCPDFIGAGYLRVHSKSKGLRNQRGCSASSGSTGFRALIRSPCASGFESEQNLLNHHPPLVGRKRSLGGYPIVISRLTKETPGPDP